MGLVVDAPKSTCCGAVVLWEAECYLNGFEGVARHAKELRTGATLGLQINR